MWKFILVALFFGSSVFARTEYRVCRPPSVQENHCDNLKKGDSKVKCVKVLDGTDCALKLIKNEVDFGVFTAEELFLVYQFYPNGIRVLRELRHNSTKHHKYELQMVALVPFSHPETTDNINSLKGGGLCHPGFSSAQNLNDNILKKFERSVYGSECNKGVTESENEVANLKKFFGKSCRPGIWVPNSSLDLTLKKNNPELCSLCDDQSTCSYKEGIDHGHKGALKCLHDGKGKVAYVALSHAQEYVDSFPAKVPMFKILCPNGTITNFETGNPCSWVKRRWNVIASREDVADDLEKNFDNWLSSIDDWTKALQIILLGTDLSPEKFPFHVTPGQYLSQGPSDSLEPPEHNQCGKDIRWCTKNNLEKNKCQWVANEAAVLGITPKIVCTQNPSTFECLRSISQSQSDIMTIDSNYGYVARKAFGLSTLLYADTDNDRNNVVLAVVKDEGAGSKFQSLKDLKGKKACFPEYGGISWMSFINVVRAQKLITNDKSCDFKGIASEIWSQACVPGIIDNNHSVLQKHSKTDASSLCSLCSEFSCAANDSNPFFRDDGAFRCIEHGKADIAFIKPNNLDVSTGIQNQHQYRVLCKNGSLALGTGFDVDGNCAWSITIDSEIVARKDTSDVDHNNMELALLKLNKWLGTDLRTPIHIYQNFNDTSNLLFKDSTVGLEPTTSQVPSVQAYKKIMMDAEECSSATLSFMSISILSLSLILHRAL